MHQMRSVSDNHFWNVIPHDSAVLTQKELNVSLFFVIEFRLEHFLSLVPATCEYG